MGFKIGLVLTDLLVTWQADTDLYSARYINVVLLYHSSLSGKWLLGVLSCCE